MTICAYCKKEFRDPKHKDNKYCSVECFRAAHPRKTKTCPTCGKQFPMDYWAVKYCSKQCSDIAQVQNVIKPCKYCGKMFSSKPSRDAIYCSVECRSKGRVDPSKKTIFVCVVCKKSFSTWTYRNQSCCSKQCASTLGVRVIKSNAKYQSIYGENWKEQKKLARKRDNHTCQWCGTRGFIFGRCLDVHHIRQVNSFNGNWRKANKLSNLITLCRSCHRDVHAGNINLRSR
jgi:5-methylcytosine-specific restriction endonuclease McrA